MLIRSAARRTGWIQVAALLVAAAGGTRPALAGDPPPPAPKPLVQPPGSQSGQPQPIATVQLKPGEVPKIEFDQPVFEFGRVPSGKDVFHDYWFTNTGNGPLEILAIKPSCGCTTMGDFDRVVQPGRKGRIPIKVSTSHASGPIMKSIAVQTNCPAPSNSVSLSIRGELWQAVQVSPGAMYFGRMVVGEESQAPLVQMATITASTDAYASITNVRSTNPVFKPVLTEVEPGKKYTLTVTATPPFKLGNNYGVIEMSTGVAALPTLSVSLTLLVTPELEVTPDKLLIPAAGSVTAKRPINVRNNGKNLMQLSNAVCSHPDVNVQLRETQPGRTWQVMVDVPVGYRRSLPEGDKIYIDTDKPGMPKITVSLVESAPYRAAGGSAPPPPPVSTGGANSGTGTATSGAADVSRVP